MTASAIVFIIAKLNIQRRSTSVRHELSKLKELTHRWLRHARRLFHMLVGLTFLIFAVAGAVLSFSEWRSYRENEAAGYLHFGFILCFTIFLVILSLYSFLKARSVR
ncbi:MAG TPA: hypothetical protein VGV68_09440 [Terriglobia bacterium]|nr:hypothetical protein [Terriglobia bacterium]